MTYTDRMNLIRQQRAYARRVHRDGLPALLAPYTLRAQAPVIPAQRRRSVQRERISAMSASPFIICETPSGCTCGAPASTPAGMHHCDCAVHPGWCGASSCLPCQENGQVRA